MKNARTWLTVCLALVFSAGLGAQSVEKTLVKSFNLQAANAVTLELEGPVDVQVWSNSTMRIQMTIGLEQGSESMLRSLIQAGRYNLHNQGQSESFLVNMPGMNREVLINGSPLRERLSYQVFVPEGVQVDIVSPASAGI